MNVIDVSLHSFMCPQSTVKLSITNKSPDTCYEVANQVFTEDNFTGNNFRIIDSNLQRALYIGPMIDLIPTYTAFLPGETKSVEVRLDSLYDLPSGHYTVQYKTGANYRACSNSLDNHHEMVQSNSIHIEV